MLRQESGESQFSIDATCAGQRLGSITGVYSLLERKCCVCSYTYVLMSGHASCTLCEPSPGEGRCHMH